MSARFTVTKTDENVAIDDAVPPVEVKPSSGGYGATSDNSNTAAGKKSQNGDKPSVRIRISDTEGKVISDEGTEEQLEAKPLTDDHETSLYKDEFSHRPRLASIINTLTNYRGGDIPLSTVEQEQEKPQARAKLGTLLGVYLPTLQNIFGVLLFIRLTWIVGTTGALEGFAIVFTCCCCTMLTAISMSAIATNGVVPGGGSYFMISRSLGPEFGGAVGILFYLGTSFAAAMYIIGAVEILLFYMERGLSLFGDVGEMSNAFNNYRVYGSILLVILFICVFLGVRFVSIVAAISLACVIISIISIYIGIFAGSSVRICMLGDVLLSSRVTQLNGTMYCSKNDTGPIYEAWCPEVNGTIECDPYFLANEVVEKPGIPGLASGVFMDNLWSKYPNRGGQIPGTDLDGSKTQGSVVTDMGASFVLLLAIFFPSCTGIMAGSNRSGDLEDAQKSIPVGTIAAIATTGTVYLTSVLFQCAIVEGALLRDKFGESIQDGLLVSHIAWPNPWVVVIGSFLSTIGAGLQSLTGAPRLLQAIAKDNVIPFLRFFSVTTKKGEPIRALFLTAMITELGILIASLDAVAPIITMFFLMCYGFVNLACALQTLLKSPSWRPRFRFYHWTLSLLGLFLCIILMFISSVIYAICAIFLAGCIYKYIEYKGAEQEWGDGISGLAMSAARYALLQLEERPPHTKNWRPQILLLMKPNTDLTPKHPTMLSLASQLKAGKGLCLVTSILEGDILDRSADSLACKQTLHDTMEKRKVKGFADVLVGHNVTEAAKHVVQISGLGGMKQNTVLMGWPYGWRHSEDEKSYRVFLDLVRVVSASQQALLVIKGVDNFPENDERLEGTIDIWWIVHDGGMLMLLPFLLMKHKVWRNCKMRLFTVAQLEDNSIQIAKDLKNFLYQLRMEAEVQVVEMTDKDISAYTYERTLIMEQRTQMLKEMKLAAKKTPAEPQSIMDLAHKPGTSAHNLKVTVSKEADSTEAGKTAAAAEEEVVEVEEEEDEEGEELLGMGKPEEVNLYTFSAGNKPTPLLKQPVDSRNVRRMHNAVRLNESIVEKSHGSQLVILNLPGPPKTQAGDENYMEFLEVLTEGLDRVLMVRGGGMEVITIFS